MTLAEALLQTALSFPPWYGDRTEDPETRAALYAPVVSAIVEVSKNKTEAAFLLAQAVEETHLARYVLEDRCHDGPPGQRCDNGKARGPWQVHAWCAATDLVGQARCALKAARGAQVRCRDMALSPWHAAFIGQSVHPCNWSGVDRRVTTAKKVLQAITR